MSSWAFLLGVSGWVFVQWLRHGMVAVAFPFELDYGEGIVWEQARLLFSSAAYGTIDRFPSIVFHYPPFFHAATLAVSRLGTTDVLAAGRTLSLLSTIGTAAGAGLLTGELIGRGADGHARVLAGLGAALLVFTCVPVAIWSPLMRVDMTAMMFAFLGAVLGVRALRSQRLIYLAALSFVLAVYTRQTSLAAPLALFAVLFWFRPGLAMRGMSLSVVVGSALLLGLNWATAGGFWRHIVLYNINRLDLERLAWILVILYYHAIYFAVALAVLPRLGVRAMIVRHATLGRIERQVSVAADDQWDAATLFLILYWILATMMTLAVAKSGASVNYLIEWMCVTIVFVGAGLGHSAHLATGGRPDPMHPRLRATALVPLWVGLQVAALHAFVPTSYERAWTVQRMAENEVLAARIRAAEKPVISDNMVMLVRTQRPVLWEPGSFAELASMGVWDEEPFVRRIRRGEFAMFITMGTRGTKVFDSRYNPRVADAIDDCYPVKEILAGYTLHLPAKR